MIVFVWERNEATDFTMAAFDCKVPKGMEAPLMQNNVFLSSRLEESQINHFIGQNATRNTNLNHNVYYTYYWKHYYWHERSPQAHTNMGTSRSSSA